MISIVMAYYNRRNLLIKTLDSIYAFKGNKSIEIICVDDASNEDEKVKDLEGIYPDLKVIEVPPEQKEWMDCPVTYNIGFSRISPKSEITIMQNPECFHGSDILSHVQENINDTNYISYACYAITKETTAKMHEKGIDSIYPLQQCIMREGINGWYNHQVHRPTAYHFCSAITTANLKKLGGFDERFSYGSGKGDRDLLDRIKRMRLNILIPDDIHHVIHQFHDPCPHSARGKDNKDLLSTTEAKNKNTILYQLSQREQGYRPKRNKYYNG